MGLLWKVIVCTFISLFTGPLFAVIFCVIWIAESEEKKQRKRYY